LAIRYFYTVSFVSLYPSRDYPLGTSRSELVCTPGGIPLAELELHDDRVTAAELRATPDTLRLQFGV
jgi:propanediol dehydratase small subunit